MAEANAQADQQDLVAVKRALVERLGFDPEDMRRKYKEERDRRVRPEAAEQYTKLEGSLENLAEDPHAKELVARAPLNDEVEVLIVGGGMTGLLTAARLRKEGVDSIRIVDTAGDFGGTWYWNDYPGIMCDVESYVYLPLIEEVGVFPTERYASGPEILQHHKAIAEKYDLYKNACFQTQVTDLRWDDAAARWIVSTNRGDVMRAQFAVLAIGGLNRGKLPQVPGLDNFDGHVFHTSRWDYDYTGGDFRGGLTGLQDKRVGLIGTGATAVQVVPHLGKWAKELYVFQRTPSSIDARGNRPTDEEWAKSLKPGWQAERVDNFNRLMSGIPVEEDMVGDGWTENFARLYLGDGAKKFEDLDLPPNVLAEVVDMDMMSATRQRIGSIVDDPETAGKLMPYYSHFCKRPCFHDDYLPTFNRPNVHLVDTEGRGVETFSPHGIVVGDNEYELDCVIFATGFDTNVRASRYTNVGGFGIHGRDGLTLTDKWANGARSLHGLHVHGFPNLIILSPIQSAYSFNWQRIADGQSEHVAYLITEAKRRGADAFEVTQAAEDEWVAAIIAKSGVQVDFLKACTPGYFNGDGKLPETAVVDGAYAGGNVAYFDLLTEWRKDGSLAGLDLR